MMRKSQFVLAAILVVVASATVSYAVSASMPSAFLPAGNTYFAVASGEPVVLTDSTAWVNMPNMSKSISIPSGHTADLIVLVCGEYNSVGQAAVVRVKVGSNIFSPSEQWVRAADVDLGDGTETGCGLFFKTGVGSGAKTVQVQWRSQYGSANQQSWNRSMLVIANIH